MSAQSPGNLFQEFTDRLEIRTNEDLKPYGTFNIGGKADYIAFPSEGAQISELIACCRQNSLPFMVIGNGSNILFHERGYRGLIINTRAALTAIKSPEDQVITAEAGVMLHELSVFALYHQLTGLEFCEGIPGTVGGALYMNAGAYGGTISDHLEKVLVIDEKGQEIILKADEMAFKERKSRLQHQKLVVLQAWFKLGRPAGEGYECFRGIFEKTRRCIRLRAELQPALDNMESEDLKANPSAGSVFGRIQGLDAKECAPKIWINQAGLKTRRIGDAQVSGKHPNFIINTGAATADEVRALISLMKRETEEYIWQQRGIKVNMEPEIICLDENGRLMRND